MMNDQIKAVLDRVSDWPPEKQRELVQIALEIEAELDGAGYKATADELKAIDDGVASETATEEEVRAAFAVFRTG